MANNKYTFKLTTHSPVSIGNGEAISPLGDYIWHKGKIFLIDKEKFESYLKQNNLINEYTKKVYDISGKTKNDFLKKEIFKGNFNDYCKKQTIDAYIQENAIEIQQIVHNVGQPYIPGSSIKGAIKTALLYNWLVFEEEGKKQLKALIYLSNKTYEQNKDLIEELCELKNEKHKDFKRIKQIKDKLKNIKKPVLNKAEKIINDFLDLNTKANASREFANLRIYDSKPTEYTNKAVYETNRLNIRNKKANDKLRVLKEAIKPNVSFDITIDILPHFKNKYLQEFNSNPVAFLKENLYYFAYNAACFEYNKLDSYDFSTENENPLTFYNEITENYSLEKDFGFLILGSGKTYLENSVGLAIFYYDEENGSNNYNNFVKIAGLTDYCQKEYPTTRTLTTQDNTPLGWIKLTHLETKNISDL